MLNLVIPATLTLGNMVVYVEYFIVHTSSEFMSQLNEIIHA